MYRRPIDLVRLFADLFQDLPPLTKALYGPGMAVLVSYPVLSVLLGPGQGGQAFVTAFMFGFALQTAFGFEALVRRLLTRFSAVAAVCVALTLVCLPLTVLVLATDPLWCQRLQSAVFIVSGGVFLVDMVKGRVATAASLWPDAEMQSHLPNLTRVMVLFHATFLVLNETLIQATDLSQWLVFWAVLPIVSNMVLRALVRTVINIDNRGEPV
ncbi:MAG: hypothetical protein B7Z10_09355 [Rhodobacterales bacterium 32-66-7]